MKLTKPRVLLSLTAVLTLGLAYVLTNGVGDFGGKAHASVTELTAQNIQSALADPKQPILIEFYSDKSPDSKAELVVLDAAADDLAGKVNIYRVNTDKEPQLTKALNSVVSEQLGQKLPTLPPTAIVMLKFDADGNPQLMNAAAGLLGEEAVVQFANDGISGKATQAPAATAGAPPATPAPQAPATSTDKTPAAPTDATPAAPAQNQPPKSVPLKPATGDTTSGAPNTTR